jgi:uncharacterized protein (TIGR02996 family)
MKRWSLNGEHDLLAAVVADLRADAPKLVYADWLEENGDARRARFLRRYVAAARSMDPADFPKARGLPEEWLELIGFRLVERIADDEERHPELRDRVLHLARPALRMKKGGRSAPVGASKIGGLPDLPTGFRWPLGQDCRAIYNDDTAGEERLAGFLAQVNLAEVADTLAGRDLPKAWLLSFFGFQDIENDKPDVIGAMAVYIPDPARLVRTKPPGKLTEGNRVMPPRRLTFAQTLDLPEAHSGPWAEELAPDPDAEYEVFDHVRELNFENVLGYARSTSGGDPTPSKASRHLILLENSVGCRLHIQLSQADLAARAFDRITLNWVDFD